MRWLLPVALLLWLALVIVLAGVVFRPGDAAWRSAAAARPDGRPPSEQRATPRGRTPPRAAADLPPLIVPVAGVDREALRDTFDAPRGGRRHEAIDILAARGTPVLAATDGRIARLYRSKPGGLTIYQFDDGERWALYYAHLERYAGGLTEGERVHRGEVIGYVGTSGNAPRDTPHLHFAVLRLGPEKNWWQGEAVNP
ncbi:MAG TPA: M23 family metallopeptidase, partial [Thermoanaerobaculia bacterium]|nr:M23 family metallopeptidase [Thermoanaerobaculia bacterium]